jgi:Restriction endonuclease NotI.
MMRVASGGRGIAELYTVPTFVPNIDWATIVSQEQCRYRGTKCDKIRKTDSSITIGTCTVNYGAKSPMEVIICPHRFLERSQIFIDCLHLLTRHMPGDEIHRLPEVEVPGGTVDYCLAAVRGGRVVDFVGIELQAMDTTGSVWPTRQNFLRSVGVINGPPDSGGYAMNWKMSAKTILMQMHHKAETFENVGRHLVLVIQDHFFNAMANSFSFGHLSSPAQPGDTVHFHAYRLDRQPNEYRLQLASRHSTDAAGVATALGHGGSARLDEKEILDSLQRRMLALNAAGRPTRILI